jgi:hypothetical protein
MSLSRSNPRAKPRWLGALLTVGVLSIFAAGVALATISQDSGFEGADGNLANNGTFDWNDFKPVTWSTSPAAPYRTSTKTVSGWDFTGLEDAQNDGADTVFAGGVKQDDSCAAVNLGPKPPNKDDLKRVYIASKKASNNHTYLALAWARIPQNTTSASAHVAFEFNQNDPDVSSCPAASRGLVPRSVANGGDMLIVYDFEGGNDPVLLKLLRWTNSTTATTGQLCEASGKAPTAAGCWVLQAALSADGNADGKVNTGDALDEIAPDGSNTLKTQEFGEAVVDLTLAGVFPETPAAGQCTSFGRMFAVSRSSGNSAQAQMKDLVGPGDIDLSNCGGLTIKKVTDPTNSGADSFSYTTSGGGLSNFSLDTNPTTTDPTDTKAFTGILAGDKYVTEGSTTGWTLTNIACTGTGSANVLYGTGQGASFDQGTTAGYDTGDTTVKVPLAVNDDITCTYTNKKNASLTITKVTDPSPAVGQTFSFSSASSGISASSPFLLDTDTGTNTPSTTTFNFNGTNYGSKTVTETVPSGWTLTDITCTGGTNTGTNPAATVDIQPGSNVTCTFTNKRLFRAIVLVCDETTLDLYSSKVALGSGTQKTTMGPITAATLPAQWTGTADQLMTYLCGLNANFGGLSPNPSTPLPDPGPYVLNLRIE